MNPLKITFSIAALASAILAAPAPDYYTSVSVPSDVYSSTAPAYTAVAVPSDTTVEDYTTSIPEDTTVEDYTTSVPVASTPGYSAVP
ncbi:hypothetical protein EV175_005763, partial [Coemansia sp. RSA 1933]